MNPNLKGAALGNITKVAMGDRTVDIRAKLPEKGLTVEQQVACLLNQATDANILGRTWVGWAPFM
jgi:DNA-dependent protein kinase catalytic subunit